MSDRGTRISDISGAVVPPHLLLVEDDPEIAELLTRFLRGAGYRMSVARSDSAMDRVMACHAIDLVLLDLLLPGEHGLTLCRRLRAAGDVRIIIVTALSELTDRVVGLELGADDYLGKPFELPELAARIRAVLRRGPAIPAPSAGTPLLFEGWRFDPERRQLHAPDGVRVPLTGAEADLLLTFCRNPRRVLARPTLLELTRGTEAGVNGRSVDLLVSRLRRKLARAGTERPLIRTVRNDGYLFDPEASCQRP